MSTTNNNHVIISCKRLIGQLTNLCPALKNSNIDYWQTITDQYADWRVICKACFQINYFVKLFVKYITLMCD